MLILGVSVVIAAVIFFIRSGYQQEPIQYRTFKGSLGWGYEIRVNDSLIIRQESIPVIAGRHGFPSEQLAAETARLVVARMRTDGIPSLTRADMERLLPENVLHDAPRKPD